MSPWWLLAIVPASMILGVVSVFGILLFLGRYLYVDGVRQR